MSDPIFPTSQKIYLETGNLERLSQGSYWLVNGRAGMRSESESWEISLWAKNVFDKHYLIDVFDVSDFGFDQLNYADPGTYGVTLHFNF
ncbi:MAG: TonB-dependent receptor [Gammaproteobacteria bacterium]|nr:TonB-dependent receptor [Gammaproteobacteria bacterium]